MSTFKLYVKTARLAIPTILENLFVSVVFLVDALFLAELSEQALAAAGMCSTVLWRLRSVGGYLQVGIGAYVARRWGQGESHAARLAFTHGCCIGLLIGLLCVPLYFFTEDIFRALRAPDTVLPYILPYFMPIMLVFPLRVASANMAAALRASGDTRTPMITTITMNLTHIFTNWLLIFGNLGFPKLGIQGAGYSTALAMTIEFLMLLAVGLRGVRPKRLFQLAPIAAAPAQEDEFQVVSPVYTPAEERDDVLKLVREGFTPWLKGVSGRIFRVSMPTFWEEIAISAGFMSFIAMIAELGDDALAAHSSISRVESFSFNAGFGVSIAASTLVGQALGSGSIREARRAFGACFTLVVMLMGTAGLLFAIAPAWFLQWFAGPDSTKFISLAIPLFYLTAIQQPLIGLTNVLAGGLRGAGQTTPPFIAQMIGVVGVRVGVAYYFAFVRGWGMEGVYLAMVCDWVMRSTLLGIIVLRGKWEKVVV
ncbi:MATE family efflux transporter [Candidatus Sumerlaeota bacterium]|nr:MATE family efflux transporter [Candidatus Sumerlaeota bacterium]